MTDKDLGTALNFELIASEENDSAEEPVGLLVCLNCIDPEIDLFLSQRLSFWF